MLIKKDLNMEELMHKGFMLLLNKKDQEFIRDLEHLD